MIPSQPPSPLANTASEWQPIESAPKDGTEIILTWMDNSEPQDIARMRWNPSATNFLFPGVVGMWWADSFTWTEHNPEGAPTHWKPIESNPLSPSPCDARVACADSTNNACPAGLAKSDDPGRGGFISEGGYCIDKQDRKRGPFTRLPYASKCPWSVDDAYGHATFTEEGRFFSDGAEFEDDLIAPWIDWKAECERLRELLGRVIEDGGPMNKAILQAQFPFIAESWKDLKSEIQTAIKTNHTIQ